MPFELIYTSAPKGLKAGSSGFCTVAYTRGMPANLVDVLESLSIYKPEFPAYDQKAQLNPVSYSHYRYILGSQSYNILSRICFAGFDYSKRSNKLAHHIVLDANDRISGGPSSLFRTNELFKTTWTNREPELLVRQPSMPAVDNPLRIAETWESMSGDAGWAGVLAESFLNNPDKPAYIVFNPGMEMLPLIDEAIMLLPPEQRWRVSFNTYFTMLPQGVKVTWRCCLPESPELKSAKRLPGTLIIDLTTAMSTAKGGPLVEIARTGKLPEKRPARIQVPVVSEPVKEPDNELADLPKKEIEQEPQQLKNRISYRKPAQRQSEKYPVGVRQRPENTLNISNSEKFAEMQKKLTIAAAAVVVLAGVVLFLLLKKDNKTTRAPEIVETTILNESVETDKEKNTDKEISTIISDIDNLIAVNQIVAATSKHMQAQDLLKYTSDGKKKIFGEKLEELEKRIKNAKVEIKKSGDDKLIASKSDEVALKTVDREEILTQKTENKNNKTEKSNPLITVIEKINILNIYEATKELERIKQQTEIIGEYENKIIECESICVKIKQLQDDINAANELLNNRRFRDADSRLKKILKGIKDEHKDEYNGAYNLLNLRATDLGAGISIALRKANEEDSQIIAGFLENWQKDVIEKSTEDNNEWKIKIPSSIKARDSLVIEFVNRENEKEFYDQGNHAINQLYQASVVEKGTKEKYLIFEIRENEGLLFIKNLNKRDKGDNRLTRGLDLDDIKSFKFGNIILPVKYDENTTLPDGTGIVYPDEKNLKIICEYIYDYTDKSAGLNSDKKNKLKHIIAYDNKEIDGVEQNYIFSIGKSGETVNESIKFSVELGLLSNKFPSPIKDKIEEFYKIQKTNDKEKKNITAPYHSEINKLVDSLNKKLKLEDMNKFLFQGDTSALIKSLNAESYKLVQKKANIDKKLIGTKFKTNKDDAKTDNERSKQLEESIKEIDNIKITIQDKKIAYEKEINEKIPKDKDKTLEDVRKSIGILVNENLADIANKIELAVWTNGKPKKTIKFKVANNAK